MLPCKASRRRSAGLSADWLAWASDRVALHGAIHVEGDVDLGELAPDEAGSELLVERVRNGPGQCPGEQGEATAVCHGPGRSGGLSMVGVAGDAAFIEREKTVEVASVDERVEPSAEVLHGHFREVTIRV